MKPDRTWKNEDDGQRFDGYDTEDGKTDWYNHDTGELDSQTDTPDDNEQSRNDEGY